MKSEVPQSLKKASRPSKRVAWPKNYFQTLLSFQHKRCRILVQLPAKLEPLKPCQVTVAVRKTVGGGGGGRSLHVGIVPEGRKEKHSRGWEQTHWSSVIHTALVCPCSFPTCCHRWETGIRSATPADCHLFFRAYV